MDFNFLPQKLKDKVRETVTEKLPVSILRTNGSIDGTPGEGYVIAFDDKIFMFSREMGADGYQEIVTSYKDAGLTKLEVRKEKFNSFLDVNVGGKDYSMKFSSFEEKNLEPMLENWAAAGGTPSQGDADTAPVPPPIPESSDAASTPPMPGADAADEKQIPPLVGFAAALMYVAKVDNEVDKREDDYIKLVCRNDRDVLLAGLDYFKTHTFEELLEAISYIDHQQKLCIYANMLELGMSDAVLHKSEQNMVKQFAKFMKIEDYEQQAVRDVLLIKNQVSVLHS